MKEPLITSRTDWDEKLVREIYTHIEDIAINDLKLDVYTNQIEVISAEQMIDAYTSIGLPVHYNHWSFGKAFMRDFTKYQKGDMGLAYEIVINSDPCISYLMEENNAITQALVIAHAAFGHNFVFKNNYLFKEWTSASSIVDYMIFAKNYIRECEEKYGEDEVELVLDAAHALSNHGVDKRRRKHVRKMSDEEIAAEALQRAEEEQQKLDIILKKMKMERPELDEDEDEDLVGEEENLLYFIFKNAPNMEQWKREILRIVYKVNQYFYPQGQTKVLNEGFATHTHYYIMTELEKRGVISADAHIAWLHLHSNVIYQPNFDSRHFDGFNPYALGFAIFQDIRRICENPTEEDREWFPNLVGKDWREMQKHAASEYRDESFIEQFLSPHLIRELRLFAIGSVKEGEDGEYYQIGDTIVKEISDEVGYAEVRRALASQFNRINYVPEIVVHSAAMKDDRLLTLEYKEFAKRPLYEPYAEQTLDFISYLWGYPVRLVQKVNDKMTVLLEC